MQSMNVISKILPVIFLILLGGVLRRTQYVSSDVIAGFKKIAVNITLPIVIFMSLIELDFKRQYLLLALTVFVCCVLLLFAGLLIKKVFHIKNKYFPVLFTSFENGMMGYGALAVVFGQSNIYPIVILDLGQTVFFALIFVTFMQVLNGGKSISVGALVLSFFKNPFVWSSAAALGLRALGLTEFLQTTPPFSAVLETFGMLAGLTAPLMCICIGYELKLDPKHLKYPLLVSLSRFALLLCVAFLVNGFIVDKLLHLDAIFKTTVYTMCMLPPFFVGAALIKDEAVAEKSFALNVISINIILFLLAFTIMTANL